MNRFALWLGLIGLSTGVAVEPVQAQAVVPDGTLNTIVMRSGNTFTITDGSAVGTNLFHSFQEFSIPTGGAAIFDNAANLQTIFSRVTGGTVSNIDGIIRANGSANLFLLNPNGILFGSNARLNISGSFIGTTAQTIRFADGSEFSASSTAPPLLTMSVPIGLQMGSNPGNITVQGTGHNGTNRNNYFAPTYPNVVNPQLQLPSGKTLGLVGSGITLDGATLSVPDGRVEIGSVAANQTISLQSSPGLTFNYTNVQNLQDISLNRAAIDVSGNNGGGLQLQGKRISLTNGSELLAHTLGTNATGQGIQLNASESLELLGTKGAGAISSIMASVRPTASGKGGDITISTPNFRMGYGAWLRADLLGNGQAGDVTFRTQKFEMSGVNVSGERDDAITDLSVGLSGRTASGKAGMLTIQSDQVRIANGARIRSDLSTGATGQPANITIQATNIEVSGSYIEGYTNPPRHLNSWISSTIEQGTTGKGSNITLDAQRIRFSNGGSIRADVLGTGTGGTVTLRAPDIEVSGYNTTASRITRISAEVRDVNAIGKGGDILIETQRLRLLDGGQINVGSRSQRNGEAGTLTINARESLAIKGAYIPPTGSIVTSGLQAIVTQDAIGQGGNISVTTPQLQILNGGEITTSMFGNGSAGNIAIQAGTIDVAGRTANGQQPSRITAAASSTTPNATGSAGSIALRGNQLTVRDGAEISVSGQQLGEAGNLNIGVETLRLDNHASLRAEVRSGSKGNITIDANAVLLRRGSQITASAGTNSDGGNITMNAPIILGLENSDIIANAIGGRGGNINITTQGIIGLEFRNTNTPRADLTNDITASSQSNVNGTVQINNIGVDPNSGLVELTGDLVDDNQQVAAGCAPNQVSHFVITGRGGVPINPMEQIGNQDRSWADLRNLSQFQSKTPASRSPSTALLQATAWHRNSQTGKVELIAARPVQLDALATCAIAPQ